MVKNYKALNDAIKFVRTRYVFLREPRDGAEEIIVHNGRKYKVRIRFKVDEVE